MTTTLSRFEGRLFAEGGCLFLVVHADEAADVARVSCRMEGHTQVIEMPFSEVARRVASSAGLILDNLNGPNSAKRIHRGKDGWYFSAREGDMGPFDSEKACGHELVRYVLSMQTSQVASRESSRSAGSRRQPRTVRRAEVESRQTA